MKAKEKTPNPPKQEPTDPDEPIDVLVNLAREGEIDPWDIDIVEVTDKFLERLDEADLARSGRGILYASILLRMKSDYLVEEGEEDEDEEEEFDEPQMGMMPSEGWNDAAGGDFDDGFDQIDALEREYERRIERRNVRDRTKPETLDELVRELRERERGTWWKEKREYDTSDEPPGPGPGEPTIAPGSTREPTTDEAVSTAHEDDIEDHIDDVWDRVSNEFEARDELLFRELIGGESTKTDVVTTYLSLLFLATRGELSLEQDDFYGDLWVKKESEV